MRLPWCCNKRQDALETRPLNCFLAPNTGSLGTVLPRRKEHEEASIAPNNRPCSFSAARGASAKHRFGQEPTSFSAKVADNGKTLIANKDSKIWLVSNPETLSGIEGRHVKVKALVEMANSQVRIMSVSAITEEQTGVRPHDAAFRR